MKDESPRELYVRLESGLSPLLRRMLASKLPVIAGSNWWEICVLSSLSPIQRDNMRDEVTLEQFDYPALVNIVCKNWKSLRHVLGIGNEFTNYLFTLKTFRNDVEHQPDLVLSETRREHLEQAAALAQALLTGTPEPPAPARRKPTKRLMAAAGLAVALVAAAAAFWWGAGQSDDASAQQCRRLRAMTEYAARFAELADVKKLFAKEQSELEMQCVGVPPEAGRRLTEAEQAAVEEAVRERVRGNLRPRESRAADSMNVRLRKMTAYSHFVEKGIFSEVDFNANYDELTRRIQRIQAHYGKSATGIPDNELLGLFELDKVPVELMR